MVPSDKPDLYLIIKTLMNLTSECITGPCLENQLYIYTYRTDLWSGMVF